MYLRKRSIEQKRKEVMTWQRVGSRGWTPAWIARKGQAKPADIPAGTHNTVAVTVRLDPDRYKRLIAYGARFAPRRKNQDIFVEALDAYLEKVED